MKKLTVLEAQDNALFNNLQNQQNLIVIENTTIGRIGMKTILGRKLSKAVGTKNEVNYGDC